MSNLFSEENIFKTEPYSVKKFNLPDSDITLYNGFFSPSESDHFYQSLLNNIEWQSDKIKFFGKEHDLPRLTAWHGETDKSYTYSNIPMNPKPWTADILSIKRKIEATAGVIFTSVLLNQYRNGNDSVSWHSDNEKELGTNPVIGSVSFGEARTFQLKHRFLPDYREKIQLTHGSFLLMKGETQHNWLHQIPKAPKALRPRINLTFRIIH